MRTSTLSFMRPQVTTDDSPKFYPHFAATGIACCPYDLCALNLKFYEDLFSPPTIPPSFIRTLPHRESLAALITIKTHSYSYCLFIGALPLKSSPLVRL